MFKYLLKLLKKNKRNIIATVGITYNLRTQEMKIGGNIMDYESIDKVKKLFSTENELFKSTNVNKGYFIFEIDRDSFLKVIEEINKDDFTELNKVNSIERIMY